MATAAIFSIFIAVCFMTYVTMPPSAVLALCSQVNRHAS
jgi:hypothetical protein